MKRRRQNALMMWLLSLIVIALLVVGFTYGAVKLLKLPIDLPFMEQTVLVESDISASLPIINTWENAIVYTPVEREPEPEPEPVAEVEPVVDISTKFDNLLNRDSLDSYISVNPDLISNGYENLFFDKVTKENSSIGVVTSQADEVMAIDNVNGIMIAGTQLNETSKGKIAFIKNDTNFNLNVVENLGYWVEIEPTAKQINAIFAVNASDYVYNYTSNYGSAIGFIQRNGDTIRKAKNTANVVGITDSMDLVIGDTTSIKSGVEGTLPLILNGTSQIDLEAEDLDNTKNARTAIGQLSDGTIMVVVADGDSSTGATTKEIIELYQKYGAKNAMLLSCGNRSTMYFNGRIINTLTNTDADGLKLPTTWVLKAKYKIEETPEEVQLNIGEVK